MRSACLCIAALTTLAVNTPLFSLSLPTSFTNCILIAGTPSAYNYCYLPSGTYDVPSTLAPANYVFVIGTGSSMFSTVLQRSGTVQYGPAPSVQPIMRINATTQL